METETTVNERRKKQKISKCLENNNCCCKFIPKFNVITTKFHSRLSSFERWDLEALGALKKSKLYECQNRIKSIFLSYKYETFYLSSFGYTHSILCAVYFFLWESFYIHRQKRIESKIFNIPLLNIYHFHFWWCEMMAKNVYWIKNEKEIEKMKKYWIIRYLLKTATFSMYLRKSN